MITHNVVVMNVAFLYFLYFSTIHNSCAWLLHVLPVLHHNSHILHSIPTLIWYTLTTVFPVLSPPYVLPTNTTVFSPPYFLLSITTLSSCTFTTMLPVLSPPYFLYFLYHYGGYYSFNGFHDNSILLVLNL